MKGLLVAALLLSLGINAWLFATRGGGEGEARRTDNAGTRGTVDGSGDPHGAGAAADPASAGEVAQLRARVAELEKELAAAKERASDAEGLDPLAMILYSRKPLSWRVRKLLEIEPEKDRMMASWKFGQALGEKEGSAREILETLKAETDPKVIALLGEILRAGAATKATPEDRRGFGELLRTGATPEVRGACVRGVFMSQGFRGGFDEKTKALAGEMNDILVAALRAESSPEVVGAIARSFADWSPPPGAVEALRETAARLPPSPGRRAVWEAIARGSFMGDQGAALVQEFQQATAQDVRDDIAAGLARAGNSMGGPMGGKPEEVDRRLEEARARFRAVYQGTSDLAVRKTLTRAALYGMGCVRPGAQTDELKSEAARFFRDLATIEPDTAQRERLERVAQAFETKGMGAYEDYDKIMAGKE
jgi:hypothetical protein